MLVTINLSKSRSQPLATDSLYSILTPFCSVIRAKLLYFFITMANHTHSGHVYVAAPASSKVRQLNQLATDSSQIIYSCKTVFPFDFFPDTIAVDKNKVDVVYSSFFFTKSVYTIMLEEVLNVTANLSLIFASLIIEVKGYEQNPSVINHLWRNQALKMRDTIMGLSIAKKRDIELSTVSSQTVKQKAEAIGTVPVNVKSM